MFFAEQKRKLYSKENGLKYGESHTLFVKR